MGRYPFSNRRTVEESLSISTKSLKDNNCLNGGIFNGCVSWKNQLDKETGSMIIIVSTLHNNEYIRFQYSLTSPSSNKENLDYKVSLVSTPCFYGGKQWWFLCPSLITDNACNCRDGVLYLADCKYFGCRHCYKLTYRSCKEHDKRIDLLSKNPDLLSAYLESNHHSKKYWLSKHY